MIYIFENDEYEKTVCVIETNEIINFYELFNEHKKEWYEGLKWSKEKYETLIQEEGYAVARQYLQDWRDLYACKIETKGSIIDSFILKLSHKYKFKSYVHIYLNEELDEYYE